MLAPFISYVGLALATSMSGALNAWLLYQGLKKANIYQLSRHTLLTIGRALMAATAMAAMIWYLLPDIALLRTSSFGVRAQAVGFVILAAVPVYFGVLGLLGVRLSHLKRQSVAENHE